MRAPLTVLSALCACALGACGGSSATEKHGGAASSRDERDVRAVVREAVTTTDPAACTRLVTRAFVEQNTGLRGAAAVRSCRDDADKAGARSVSIDRVTVTGTSAEARISPRGGHLPFQTATLALEKSGRSWKVARLTGGKLDRRAFERTVREDLADPPAAFPAATRNCVVDELSSAGDVEVVRAYVRPDLRIFVIAVGVCAIGDGLASSSIPKSVVACVVRDVRRELTSGATARRLARDPSNLALLQSVNLEAAASRITRACVTGAASGTVS